MKLPQSLYVEDVTLVPDPQYHRQGGHADVYKGSNKDGIPIAVKKPRLMGNRQVSHKVQLRFFVFE
jgi:hypothetical protein